MLLLILGLSFADENKKTIIDFEAVDIEGQIKKPYGSLVQDNQRAMFNPLVKIREEWTIEITGSITEVD